MSMARTLCVSAPTLMCVTPAAANAPTVSTTTLPLASLSTRPPSRATASDSRLTSSPPGCEGSCLVMLSSMTRVTCGACPASSAATTSSTSASVRVSTSILMPCCCSPWSRMYASARAMACVTPPAAVTWLSLIIIMSYSPMRWLCPPPMSTAHLSSSRSPGAVLRVSRILGECPPAVAAATMARVAVAIPDMRCMKLSATRSATRMDAAGPHTRPNTWPAPTTSPSHPSHATVMAGSTAANTASATPRPASTPALLARNVPVARVPGGTVASVVTSPIPPASSSSASLITLWMSYVG
mmetsp:Transcript_4905/g.12023  ORF Transcript_4905/g.12023 Transcript_4905/m.12023 type:complete len:298 (-) Transcript_4905:171-1064(-)